jgi:hypothetical protein
VEVSLPALMMLFAAYNNNLLEVSMESMDFPPLEAKQTQHI